LKEKINLEEKNEKNGALLPLFHSMQVNTVITFR
jgi:hypothetical protein